MMSQIRSPVVRKPQSTKQCSSNNGPTPCNDASGNDPSAVRIGSQSLLWQAQDFLLIDPRTIVLDVQEVFRCEFLRVQRTSYLFAINKKRESICLLGTRNVSPRVCNSMFPGTSSTQEHLSCLQSTRNVSPRLRNQQRMSLTPPPQCFRDIIRPRTSFFFAINKKREPASLQSTTNVINTPNCMLPGTSSTQEHLSSLQSTTKVINSLPQTPPPTREKSNFHITLNVCGQNIGSSVSKMSNGIFSSCVHNTSMISCDKREREYAFQQKDKRNAFRVGGVGQSAHTACR